MRQQHAPHVGMHDDRIGRLVGILGAGQRAALQALAGIGDRALVGGLGEAEPLHADARRAAFIMVNMARMPLFGSPTSQPVASSKFITQVGRGLDAHLVLDGAAARRRCARPSVPSAFGRNFGTRNRLMPLMPGGASGRRASTRWTMFSVRSCSPAEMKILVPVMRVAAVALRHGLGAQQAEIGAAMRLGQAHGAGPGAVDQLRQIGLPSARRCRGVQRVVGAVAEAGIHAEGQVGRADHLLDQHD